MMNPDPLPCRRNSRGGWGIDLREPGNGNSSPKNGSGKSVFATVVTLMLTTAGETRSARSAKAGKEARDRARVSSACAAAGATLFWISGARQIHRQRRRPSARSTTEVLLDLILILLKIGNDRTLIPFDA